MRPATFAFRCIMPCIAALLAWSDASAICTPFNAPPPRFVGDTASDSSCTDDTIQSAIDFIKSAGYACPAKIYITREHTYTSQHLTIDSVSTPLTIVGEGDGVHCGSTDVQICDPMTGCPPPPTAPLVTIDGSHTSGRVLTMTGYNNVTLLYLTIKDGMILNDSGGGIGFDGSGSLTIDTSAITFNEAGYGGGINFKGAGDPATDPPAVLTLNANTLVLDNVADTSGGGIRMDGNARLFVLQPQTLIAYNEALGGYGGGVEVVGLAQADIGSPGYNGSPVIQYNDAQYGGGIAVTSYGLGGDSNYQALARLFTVDPMHPVQVSDNSASRTGGGIWLKPNFLSLGAQVCANDFRIDDNIAQEGTAIYADLDGDSLTGIYDGSGVELNQAFDDPKCVTVGRGGDSVNPDPVDNHGAVHCAQGVVCNTISGNVAEDSTNVPTDGSTILVQDAGTLQLNRTAFRNNQGAHVIRVFGTGAYAGYDMANCLMADNTMTGELIDLQYSDAFNLFQNVTTIDSCTLANNSIGGASVIISGYSLGLSRTLIDQPGVPTLVYNGDSSYSSVQYVMSNDISTLPNDPTIVAGTPSFVDAAAGDYHLQTSSPGVDFAPMKGDVDLDYRPRSIDLAAVANFYGPQDLGPYERQNIFDNCGASDSIYCNGFDH